MLKKYANSACSFLLLSLLVFQSAKIHASSAPVLPYSMYVVPVALSALCIVSFGWSWLTAEKVAGIDKKLELVMVDVKNVQARVKAVDERVQNVQQVQDEHTSRFIALQSSSDTNFKALGDDISALKDMTDKGLKELSQGQQDIMRNVDGVRGLVDRQFESQAQELAQLKALVGQLHKKISESDKFFGQTYSLQSSKASPSCAPYVHASIFSAAK